MKQANRRKAVIVMLIICLIFSIVPVDAYAASHTYYSQHGIVCNGKTLDNMCFLTSFAMVITDMGYKKLPLDIYIINGKNANASWGTLANHFDVNISDQTTFKEGTQKAKIKELLTSGNYPQGLLIRFKRADGSKHMIVAIEYKDNDIRFNDPAAGKNVTMSQIHNYDSSLSWSTVYAYQTVTKTCHVNFNANGGEVSPTTKKIDKYFTIGKLPSPSRNGYSFNGWYTAKTGGAKISTSTRITADKTFYAQWAVNRTVSFDGNGKSVCLMPKIVKNNTAIGELPSINRAGYSFNGWYTAKTGGTKISTSTKITADTTYYAQWTINRTVTFDANGGSVSPRTKTVKNNAKVGTLPKPTRKGYTFSGWYTDKFFGAKISKSTQISTDRTFYAHWTKGPTLP